MITSLFYPRVGGAEIHAQRLSIELTRLGFKVEVYTTDPSHRLPRQEVIQGIPVHRFPSYDPLNSGWCLSLGLLNAMSHASGLDIIHCHKLDCFPTLAAAWIAPKRDIPLLITPHLGLRADRRWIHQIYFPTLARWCVSRAQVVCPVSETEVRRLRKLGALTGKERLEQIPIGAPDELFALPRSINEDKPLTVLFVGRLESSQKGIDRLCHIVASSNDRLIFRIVGEGPEVSHILHLTESFPGKLAYLGAVHNDDLIEVYAHSDVLIIPSRLESNPAVVLEAMAAGLPVLGSDIPSIRALIRQGFNGYLITNPDDPRQWLSCLHRLDNDRHHLSDMASNARASVEGRSWSAVAQRYSELYQSLLKG